MQTFKSAQVTRRAIEKWLVLFIWFQQLSSVHFLKSEVEQLNKMPIVTLGSRRKAASGKEFIKFVSPRPTLNSDLHSMDPISTRTWFAFQSDASCCWWNLSCVPWKSSTWELLHCHGYKVKYTVGSGGHQRKLVVWGEKWPLYLEFFIYVYMTFCTYVCYLSVKLNKSIS